MIAAFLLASIPLYALAGWSTDARATDAAMKYYLSGAFTGVAMITVLRRRRRRSSMGGPAVRGPDTGQRPGVPGSRG